MELAVAGLVTLSVGLAVGLALAIAGLLRTRREAHRDLQALESQCERFEEAVARRTVELSDTHEELAAACAVRDRLEGELQRSRRMEAVGRLAGGTLHDFNNLLTTITVYAELLEAALPEKSPLREEVGQIQEANRQAARLAGQLGRRRQLGEETPGIDLGELLRESAPMLGHLLGPDVEIHLAVPKHPLPAAVDPDQLRQVMINLALNARDAMPTGGHFTVEAGGQDAHHVELDRLTTTVGQA